jgi:hexulose-6-phosphate isomerase
MCLIRAYPHHPRLLLSLVCFFEICAARERSHVHSRRARITILVYGAFLHRSDLWLGYSLTETDIMNDIPFQIQGERLTRRAAIGTALAAGGAAAFGTAPVGAAPQAVAAPTARAARRYDMQKSINLWAFPYPQKMSLVQCLQLAKDAGFDGIELNYDLDSDLSPKAGPKDLQAIRKTAEKIGIAISGLCSFLFWPYPLTSNDPDKRARALELAAKMTEAAHELGTENLLVVPGAVHIPWRTDYEPVPNDVCDARAREAIGKLLPTAEKLGVYMNIENIFFNGYLMTPGEMIDFCDSFRSGHLRVHFDTGNIMMFQFPEHWISILGSRIKNVHLKEFTKKGTDYSLEAFRPLLDGTTDWPAVVEAFDKIGYRGYLTFEYFHPYLHYPEALVYQTSDSLDRMLGRK